MNVANKLYTAEEVWGIAAHSENLDKRLELFEGVIKEKMSPSFLPSAIAAHLVMYIGLYVKEHDLGYVTGADGGYVMAENMRFIPDVGFVSKSRLPKLPDRDVPVPPDLAVEVVSPSDDYRDVQKKVLRYIAYGTRLVWVVYPDDQTVDVYRPGEGDSAQLQTLDMDSVLDGGDVLPGFALPLRELFISVG